MNSSNNSPSMADDNPTMQPPLNLDAATLTEETSKKADDISKLRALGKELFTKRDCNGALKAYDRWLELEPESSMAHSNKSAAHMVLKQWESTYLSARRAQELDPSNIKAAYRRGVALMRMRCYAGAVSVLEAATAGDPSEQSIARALKEAQILAKQATTGKYDPEVLYSGDPKSLIADYVGPVEVFQTATMGRGLRVTRDVQPGELLFVEKALASMLPDFTDFPGISTARNNRNRHNSAAKLLKECLTFSLGRHRLEARVPNSPSTTQQPPSIQRFSPFSTEEELFSVLQEGPGGKSLKARREKQFLDFFLASATDSNVGPSKSDAIYSNSAIITPTSRKDIPISIWVLKSLLNHSCLPNVTGILAEGPLYIVRASRHLTAGQELFINYFNVHHPLQTRRQSLKNYNFTCSCERCMFEQRLPANIKKQMVHIEQQTDRDKPGPLFALLIKSRNNASIKHAVWEQLYPLICKVERDVIAAGVSDKERDWCINALSHSYQMLAVPALLKSPELAWQLTAKWIGAEHTTLPGSFAEVEVAASFAMTTLVKDYSSTPEVIPMVPESEAEILLLRAIMTRYGHDLTIPQVAQISNRIYSRYCNVLV